MHAQGFAIILHVARTNHTLSQNATNRNSTAFRTLVVSRRTRKTTSPHSAYFIQTTGGRHAQTTLPRTSHFITTTSGQHIHSCALHAQNHLAARITFHHNNERSAHP
jgi:hypothetical protein